MKIMNVRLGLVFIFMISVFVHKTMAQVNQPNTRQFIDPSNFDYAVKPGNNFYKWVNEGWVKRNPIPSTETRWGSFSEIQEFNYKALKQILEADAVANAPLSSIQQKVGDFYISGMDSTLAELKGYSDIISDLARIDNLTNVQDVLNEVTYQHRILGQQTLFLFGAQPDDKDVAKMFIQLYQGGLSLPEKSYYFDKDTRTTNIRNQFIIYATKLFEYIGETPDSAQLDANSVLSLETKLARASMDNVEQRDPEKIYHKLTIEELTEQTPHINWTNLLANMGVTGWDSVLVGQPVFFATIDSLSQSVSMKDWKIYLKWNILNSSASYLSNNFVVAYFDFYGKTLRGQKVIKPRWKRVLSTIDSHLGEALGQEYVEQYFKPTAKERMIQLVNNLQETFADRIKNLSWMSEATKQKALYKLFAFTKKIAYTDKWIDYSTVQISKVSYLDNVRSCNEFEYLRNINKLGKPVDRTDWGMTPPTVNAYYNPIFNEIVFPAGILHFPFFDADADDAINYGGIGAVIGHEMTHGFDDQGSQYDAFGNLSNWWTSDDKKHFDALTKKIVLQYNKCTVLNNTLHVNGKLTLGENIADFGGVNIAYAAFKRTAEGKSNKKIDKFTPDQRFFISWGQIWRSNSTDADVAFRIKNDPHSPTMFRCNVPLSNMPEFYKAFHITSEKKMWRPENDRVKIW